MDDKGGIVCRVVLPPNAAIRQVDSEPCSSKDMARRNVCLKACQMLHKLGALTDYLLPDMVSKKTESTMHSSGLNSHAGMLYLNSQLAMLLLLYCFILIESDTCRLAHSGFGVVLNLIAHCESFGFF
jgi:Dicer dimerisation domain